MARKRLTVADMRAQKGKGQLTMLRVTTLEQAAAAEAAGIDVVSVPPDLLTDTKYRQVAPSLFSMTGKGHLQAGTRDDYLRFSGLMMQAGADAIYCAGGISTVKFLADEYIPVVGHVGLVPSRTTWTGGYRAVGKTADSAMAVYNEIRALEAAGAFAVEIEVVPVEVATEINRRVKILLWSMGAGPGCDAQYMFAEDILGENREHLPRHSKVYRNFAAEYDRLQTERIAAFTEFAADVATGAYPEPRHLVGIDPEECAKFRFLLGAV